MTREKEIALLSLIHRNKGIIYKVCSIYCHGDDYVFADMCAEVIATLSEEVDKYGLTRLEPDSNEAAWVYKIAYCTAINFSKRYAHKLTKVVRPLLDIDVPCNEDQQQKKEQVDELLSLVKDEKDREILKLHLEGYNYAEIATKKQTSETAITSRISRLYAKLRKLVQHDYYK